MRAGWGKEKKKKKERNNVQVGSWPGSQMVVYATVPSSAYLKGRAGTAGIKGNAGNLGEKHVLSTGEGCHVKVNFPALRWVCCAQRPRSTYQPPTFVNVRRVAIRWAMPLVNCPIWAWMYVRKVVLVHRPIFCRRS